MSDVEDAQAVNAALYEAFESADVDRMERVWDDVAPDAVVCVHPGWPMLRGREQVLRSWSAVMAGTDYIQFFLTDVRVHVRGDVAVVTCTENVLTEVTEAAHAGATVVATNVLVRRPDGWRVQVHHGSPVLGQLVDEEPKRARGDRISLTGLRVRGFHGVLPQERRDGQDFLVDAVLHLDLRPAGETDDLTRTVHYGELAERLAAVVAGEPVDLLETLAGRLAEVCLRAGPVERVELTVHKPSAPIALDFADVSVTVVRP